MHAKAVDNLARIEERMRDIRAQFGITGTLRRCVLRPSDRMFGTVPMVSDVTPKAAPVSTAAPSGIASVKKTQLSYSSPAPPTSSVDPNKNQPPQQQTTNAPLSSSGESFLDRLL